jgi:hypothetical protein
MIMKPEKEDDDDNDDDREEKSDNINELGIYESPFDVECRKWNYQKSMRMKEGEQNRDSDERRKIR